MAESLAALGIAANIVQFVELGFKVTKSIIETYRNIDNEGLAARHVDLSSITTSLKDRCTQLQNDAGVRADAITMELLRRCIKISTELLSQLESLTLAAGKRDQRWAKFVVSVKASWKKSTIEGLHARMMDVKTEIFGRLESLIHQTRVSMSTSEAMLPLGEASAAWNDATKRRLDSMVNDLRGILRSESDVQSAQMLAFADSLSRFADESKKQGAIRDILLSLKFTQIKERQNEILQAHKNTFEWMFDESSEVNFCSWLERPNEGVFWITGKPGSGKSTLMKLILNHPKTLPLARKWSRSKPLVIASHFFWSVGSRLQRSQEGLLRTLLFQILVHCPEIIPRVCSRRYSNPFLALGTWSLEELSESFDNLRRFDELPRRVLLLVDGLDEYSGNHEALTMFLCAIAQSSDIKVCCASRPWAHFAEAFGHGPWKFEMQHLTREDMRLFIADNLGQNERFRNLRNKQRDSAERMIQTISDKSEGVFFWVSLVVKSILRGLGNQDGFEILQQRLSQLPSDLYQFFQRMLDSVEDVYRDTARLYFLILLSSSAPLPVDVFVAIDQLPSPLRRLEGPDRIKKPARDAMLSPWDIRNNAIFSSRKPEPVVAVDSSSRIRKKSQVLARCRDLVQSWQVDGDDPRSIRIGFLHRTVVDFLHEAGSLRQFEAKLLHSPRYMLAITFAFCQFNGAFGSAFEVAFDLKLTSNEYILRMFYCIQEAETDDLRRDGEHFLYLCRSVMQSLIGMTSIEDSVNISFFIVHTMARLLTIQPSLYEQFDMDPSQRSFTERLEVYILEGSLSVAVGDYATLSRSDLIDLQLLDDLILVQARRHNISQELHVASIWKIFIKRLRDHTSPLPRNIFQACQVLVRHGAKRRMFLPADVERDALYPSTEQIEYDVLLDVFQEKGIFDADQLDELAGLFRPEIESTPDSKEELYVSPVSRFWKFVYGAKGT